MIQNQGSERCDKCNIWRSSCQEFDNPYTRSDTSNKTITQSLKLLKVPNYD